MEYLCPRCATLGSVVGYCATCTTRNDAEYVRIGALSPDQLRMLRFADTGRKWSADVEQDTFPIVVLPAPEPELSDAERAFFSRQLVPQLPLSAIFAEYDYSRNFAQAPSVRAEQD